ncbi:NfeD family protein [Noviherbaspirillum sp. CPCC 100848]|uniref:NfeD family protein n=1 Tax=Noviherbaspirillum album TaxID=3080276 RepID=A0ABU6J719_9BURK|nr:NfeD family protein [Noviherbaspirillum sp. CPCC 100848]MEC4719435.1 NfeD family protein [Noviherbaspirillum sp. CPCC 100848]
MVDWMIWMLLAGGLVILEMFIGTFYLLMIAIGLASGALMALAGEPRGMQFLVAAVVGIVCTVVLRRSRWGRKSRSDAARDPNVNLDIGQAIEVSEWAPDHGLPRRARVMYRGALWDVELEQGVPAVAGTFVIREIRGSRLIVSGRT